MIIEDSKKADITFSTSGNHTLIAAPGAGKYLAIDHINFIVAGATNVYFVDGTTQYGGLYTLTTNQAMVLENVVPNQKGVITCSDNSAFVINSSAAVVVGGFVRYRICGGN